MRDRLMAAIQEYKTRRQLLKELDEQTEKDIDRIMKMYTAAHDEHTTALRQLQDVIQSEISFGLLDKRLVATEGALIDGDGMTSDLWPAAEDTAESLENNHGLVPSEVDTE